MKEKWKPVKGYEDQYAVSDLGRVKSLSRVVRSGKKTRRVPEKVLAQTCHPDTKYMRIQLSSNGKTSMYLVHNLVLESFKGKRPKFMEANHLNGNRVDNRLTNLEWDEHQPAPHSGEKHWMAKLNDTDVRQIRDMIESGCTLQQAADFFGISRAHVSLIKNNKLRVNI